MRKSGYEKAARAVPGRGAFLFVEARDGNKLIGGVFTILEDSTEHRIGVRFLSVRLSNNVVMELETNTSSMPAPRKTDESCRTKFGVFPECPLCGGSLTPEHAHFKCFSCGWRDSCCD